MIPEPVASQDLSSQYPILVTGIHRSGTTWVGKMLAGDRRVAYISEPLNVLHRPGVMRAPVEHWYTYICTDNEGRYLDAVREMLAFRYHLSREIRSLRSLKDTLRLARDGGIFLEGWLFRRRPLIKDPFAVFSSEWFAKRLGCQVVITIRHPAAFVSSLKRLRWEFEFHDLLAQPYLLRDWLAPYRAELEEIECSPEDILAQGCLLWRLIYGVVAQMIDRNPGFILVRHEDLSRDPMDQFRELYALLGLDFSARIARSIQRSTSESNPREISRKNVHSIRLDSRGSLANWKHKLTREEIERVKELTAEVSPLFYSEREW